MLEKKVEAFFYNEFNQIMFVSAQDLSFDVV